MSFNAGDTVRINDPFTPELDGVTGTIIRKTPYETFEVEIEPTAEIIELFNSFGENTDGSNPDATPTKVYFMDYELEAA